MNAHTPGPWEIRRRGAAFSSHEIRPAKPFPGVIPLAWVAKLNDGEANARLIAAAPDLLAALRHVSSCSRCAHDGWEDCPGGLDALAALVKAAP